MTTSKLRVLIVDGHSIIHAWPELRTLHLKGAKRYMARERLLQSLRTLQDMTQQRIVVVFDGTQAKVHTESARDDLQIFYSDASHTADGIIERLVAKYADQFEMRVVTADRMIWETTRSFGAFWMSPEDLAMELKTAENQLQQNLKKYRKS